MSELAFHPLADVFPLIEGGEFDELVSSIKEHGLRHPIVTLDGMILDGRNRYRACIAADVAPLLEVFKGRDPIAFVIDENVRRRHLTTSQRAMAAAKIATMRRGDNQHTSIEVSSLKTSQDEAAKALSVSLSSVQRAARIRDLGTAEQVDSVVRGRATVDGVAKQLKPSVERRTSRDNDKHSQRVDTIRRNAQMWGALRDAINNLTSLPMPSDVLSVARGQDKARILDAKLSNALNWLKDFNDAYHGNRRSDAA